MSDVQEPVFDFGAGKTVITTGTHCDYPAVFIEPAKNPGEVGASSKREGAPAGSLVDGGVALRFPTFERARGVANALVGQPSTDKKEPTGWRDIESAPKDGTRILVGETYRWMPYKKGAPKGLQGKGRWMVMNEYGGWDRAQNKPAYWMPPPGQDTSEPEALRETDNPEDLNLITLGFDEVVRHKDEQLEALRAENAALREAARYLHDWLSEQLRG